MENTIRHKVCKECDKYLLITDFAPRRGKCKACIAEYYKIKYNNNRENIIESYKDKYREKRTKEKEIEELKRKIDELEKIISNKVIKN